MKIKALITLHFDGKEIKPNETAEIKDDEARRLIKRGFAVEEKTEAKKDKNAV